MRVDYSKNTWCSHCGEKRNLGLKNCPICGRLVRYTSYSKRVKHNANVVRY